MTAVRHYTPPLDVHQPRERATLCRRCGTPTWQVHAVCDRCGPVTCDQCAEPATLAGQAHVEYAAALAALLELYTADWLPVPQSATVATRTGRPSIEVVTRTDADRDLWARNLTDYGAYAAGTSVGTVTHRDRDFVVTVTTAAHPQDGAA